MEDPKNLPFIAEAALYMVAKFDDSGFSVCGSMAFMDFHSVAKSHTSFVEMLFAAGY